MSSSSSEVALSAGDSSIAPRWHTAALVGVILAVATTGALLTMQAGRGGGVGPSPGGGSAIAAVYLPIVVVQWGLALYVCRVGRARNALGSLLGARWHTTRRALSDVGLAAVGWAAIEACEVAWRTVSRSGVSASASAILPHTMPERLAWVAVAVSVGVSEELVYRGYFQVQLAAFTRRPNLAMGLQASLFGVAHLEQGAGTAARLAFYGLAFGVLARWRQSLVPCILCHVWTDLASGLLHR